MSPKRMDALKVLAGITDELRDHRLSSTERTQLQQERLVIEEDLAPLSDLDCQVIDQERHDLRYGIAVAA